MGSAGLAMGAITSVWTIRLTILRVGSLVIAVLMMTVHVARADLLFGNFGSTPVSSNTVLRYREDGTFLGVVGEGGETNQGIALGPNGNLYIVSNNVGFGRIEQFNPLTGAS